MFPFRRLGAIKLGQHIFHQPNKCRVLCISLRELQPSVSFLRIQACLLHVALMMALSVLLAHSFALYFHLLSSYFQCALLIIGSMVQRVSDEALPLSCFVNFYCPTSCRCRCGCAFGSLHALHGVHAYHLACIV